jgi:hypothetical protein
MLTYPQLTSSEQAHLPKLLAKPIAMPSKFDDSTHNIWHCQTADGEMVLKVCNQLAIKQSTFWLGLNHLFAADFPNNLAYIERTHHLLGQNGALPVPKFVATAPNRFVLTRYLAGHDLNTGQISEAQVVALANHIAHLHQPTYAQWGSLHAPTFATPDWGNRLHTTLCYLVTQRGLSMTESLIEKILSEAKYIQESIFVAMMLDLRWDQLRSLENGDLALIDLDAFVIAPKNLDLVLLQYLLTPAQWLLFKTQYCQVHTWPDYTLQKPSYQLLLFLMNILGETNLTRWMGQI